MSRPGRPFLGMILKGYPRISETFISNEILLLESLGFNIRIFSMRRPRESFTHESVSRIRAWADYLPESILKGLPRLVPANLHLAQRRPAEYRRALALMVRRYRRTRKTATIKHLLQAGLLVDRLLPGQGVAHLHAHFAHSPASVAMFSSMLSGLPFSFTAHAKDIYTSDPAQLREKLHLARFAATCTEANRRYLADLAGPDAGPIHRVYHGIDLSLFQASLNGHRPEPPYRVLTVARLTAKKGLPTVLRAVRCLIDQGVAVEHTLIGDGEERKATLALIQSLGLSQVTRYLGTLPHEEVVQHYRRADLFVLGCEITPNGDRDGIPNVILESMAMGVPVVATPISAIPEVVKHEKTGLLVEPGRPEDMAGAMTRLLTDEPLRRGLVNAARAMVAENFDNRVLIRDLAAIFSQAGL